MNFCSNANVQFPPADRHSREYRGRVTHHTPHNTPHTPPTNDNKQWIRKQQRCKSGPLYGLCQTLTSRPYSDETSWINYKKPLSHTQWIGIRPSCSKISQHMLTITALSGVRILEHAIKHLRTCYQACQTHDRCVSNPFQCFQTRFNVFQTRFNVSNVKNRIFTNVKNLTGRFSLQTVSTRMSTRIHKECPTNFQQSQVFCALCYSLRGCLRVQSSNASWQL